jgi:hypothetical protein
MKLEIVAGRVAEKKHGRDHGRGCNGHEE